MSIADLLLWPLVGGIHSALSVRAFLWGVLALAVANLWVILGFA